MINKGEIGHPCLCPLCTWNLWEGNMFIKTNTLGLHNPTSILKWNIQKFNDGQWEIMVFDKRNQSSWLKYYWGDVETLIKELPSSIKLYSINASINKTKSLNSLPTPYDLKGFDPKKKKHWNAQQWETWTDLLIRLKSSTHSSGPLEVYTLIILKGHSNPTHTLSQK